VNAAASQDPFVGKIIDDRYEIQSRIGEGGMGVVYKARQKSIDRIIAIKMLNAQMAADPTWVQRFYNEAKACSRLQHPNTIRMFDFGQSNEGRLFMTMEFLDGVSLREALAKGPLAPQRVVKVLIQCCASLAEAHSIGIIHRDIKPDNVFLLNMAGSPDFVKLLDFSVAKLLEGDRMKTQAGVVFGTPQYMSPEQGRGLPLDARSDLYALGILAFEMLMGAVPFNDDNPMTVIQMHLHTGVPALPQSVPPSVQAIVRRALEKDPSRRYQSAGEMMQHCQQVFAEVSQGGFSIGPGGMPKTMVAPPPANVQAQLAQMQMGQQPGYPPNNAQLGVQNTIPQGMQAPMVPQQPLQSSAGAKTMVATPSPFANQGMNPGMSPNLPGMPPAPNLPGMPPAPGGPQAFSQASPMQKTIVAVPGPQIVGGQLVQPPGGSGMQGGYPGGHPGMHGGHPGMHGHPGMQGGPPPPNFPGGPGGPGGPSPNKTVMLQPSEGVVSVAMSGHQSVQPAGMAPSQSMSAPAAVQGASTLFWIVSLVIGVAVGALAYVVVLQL
jgi:serine/threonine-protein kinase